jgi:hypothetical protein
MTSFWRSHASRNLVLTGIPHSAFGTLVARLHHLDVIFQIGVDRKSREPEL